jgi:hypothetical protein
VRRVAIPRRDRLSPRDLVRDHLGGVGTPVIITDAVSRWPAYAKWNFEYMKHTYGDDFVMPQLGFGGRYHKLTRLSAYLRYLDRPKEDFGGFWLDENGRPTSPPSGEKGSTMYLLGWKAFQRHPELVHDIQPGPRSLSDWTLHVAKSLPALRALERANEREYWSLYIGPADTLTPLHQDFGDTFSYLAMVRGAKRILLFSPADSDRIYGGRIDPELPDFERFPRLAAATAHEAVIGPGEMLFMPANWWHWLRAEDKFMTVSHNFFNRVNARQHFRSTLRTMLKGLEGRRG